MTQLSGYPWDLLSFAYQLRIQDTENKYSENLLNGCVTPSVLVDIICANRQKKFNNQMDVDLDQQFMINVGSSHYLSYSDTGNLQIKNSSANDKLEVINHKFQFVLA